MSPGCHLVVKYYWMGKNPKCSRRRLGGAAPVVFCRRACDSAVYVQYQ